jgi:hypothetical protein
MNDIRLRGLAVAGSDAAGRKSPHNHAQTDAAVYDHPWLRLGVQEFLDAGDLDPIEEWVNAKIGHANKSDEGPLAWPKESRPLWLECNKYPGYRERLRRTFAAEFLSGQGAWDGELYLPSYSNDTSMEIFDATVAAGWHLLHEVLPTLTPGIAPHVAGVASVRLSSADTEFLSGSVPDLPGLIFLSSKATASSRRTAESILHEACHCKYFDICITRTILGPDTNAFTVAIPWIDPSSRRSANWAIDQALAAAHAYVHLALLDTALSHRDDAHRQVELDAGQGRAPNSFARATYLITELKRAGADALGAEGPAFIGWLSDSLDLIESLDYFLSIVLNDSQNRYRLDLNVMMKQSPGGRYVIGSRGSATIEWCDELTGDLMRHWRSLGEAHIDIGVLEKVAESLSVHILEIIVRIVRLCARGFLICTEPIVGDQ